MRADVPPSERAVPGITGPGGGRVGALVISRFVRPGTSSTTSYNHYSLLASLEDLFGLPRLGDAAVPGLPASASTSTTPGADGQRPLTHRVMCGAPP